MPPFAIHTLLDLLAVLLALLSGWLVIRFLLHDTLPASLERTDGRYFLWLGGGSVAGSYLAGSLNLYLSGIPEIGRSILGALCGAIVMVEWYKHRRGIRSSTGAVYVVPFCVCVVVGRIGCLLSGLHDHTHGIATTLPWGRDYGDGVLRHPVPLYESMAMLAFLLLAVALFRYHRALMVRKGFYLCTGFYALQRFGWEFLKPYATLGNTLNLFQYLCLVLVVYSALMLLYSSVDDIAPS